MQFTDPERPIARNDPGLDAAWNPDRSTIGHWLQQSWMPFCRQMKLLLDAYAAQLTR